VALFARLEYMQKLHFSITIPAPKEVVWHVMLDRDTYKEWTKVFMEGSDYEGSWTEGSRMKFVAQNPDGTFSGMSSEIKEVRPYDFVSIRHLGEIQKNEEVLWDEKVTGGEELLENYTFIDKGEETEVLVDIDSNEEFKEMFQEMWPKALESLKEVVLKHKK
jgi:uncharacterized protein YndB with AHSA1/START domain